MPWAKQAETVYGEVWKEVPNWPYAVSNLGNVINILTKKNLIKIKTSRGYLVVTLHRRSLMAAEDKYCNKNKIQIGIHRIVYLAFFGVLSDHSLQINHIDGNKENNCLSNLELVTPKGNMRHAKKLGLTNHHGIKNGQAKLTDEKVMEIREAAKILLSKNPLSTLTIGRILSEQFGVSLYTIKHVVQGTRWSHLPNKVKSLTKKKMPLSDDQVDKIRELYNRKIPIVSIARQTGISFCKVYDIIRGKSYSNVGTVKINYVNNYKLEEDQVRQIKMLFKQFSHERPMERYRALSSLFGVSISNIKNIINGRSWTHVKVES